MTDIDVFYWLAPPGLEFLVNKGLDAPLIIGAEGHDFQTSYSVKVATLEPSVKVGVVRNSDQVDVRVRLRSIHQGMPEDIVNPVIKFNQHNTIMRAVKMASPFVSIDLGDRRTAWRLWDNFGCEHAFFLFPGSDGHSLELGDIN